MRSMRSWMLFVLVGSTLAFATPHNAVAQADSTVVAQTVRAFARGAATRDTSLLQRALHPISIQFVRGTPFRAIDRATYMRGIGEGRIGGAPIDVSIRRIHVDGNVAFAEATFTTATLVLSHSLTLVKESSEWLIMSTVVSAQPPANGAP